MLIVFDYQMMSRWDHMTGDYGCEDNPVVRSATTVLVADVFKEKY